MIIGRHKNSTLEDSKHLPADWTEEFVKILNNSYAKESEKDNRFFDVHGMIFNDEFVAIVSYVHLKDSLAAPISVFISHDIIEETKKMSKALDNLVDLTGLIFDDIFSKEEWNEFVPHWTENNFKGFEYSYKITRENFSLTLQAEEILKNEGPI